MSAVASPLETLPALGSLSAFTRSRKWKKWTAVNDPAFRALVDNEDAGEDRLWAFVVLRSWGHTDGPKKYAADERGKKIKQADAARALGVSRTTVGRWLESLAAQNRCYFNDEAGFEPVDDPSVPPADLSHTSVTKKSAKSEDWRTFTEVFAIEFPDIAAEDESARAVLERNKRKRLAAYKTWKAGAQTETADAAELSRMYVTESSEPEPETLDFDVQTPSALVPDSPLDSVPTSVTLSAPVLIEREEEIKSEKRVGRLVAEVPTDLPKNEPKNSFSELPEQNLPKTAEPENLPDTAAEIELLNVLDRNNLAVPPADPILSKFVALATSHSIPVISLCRAIFDKCNQKAASGRRIFSAYALHDYLAKGDLRQWIAQNGREVEQDRRSMRREQEPEPYPTSNTESIAEMRLQVEAAIADPTLSEEERSTYLRLLETMGTW